MPYKLNNMIADRKKYVTNVRSEMNSQLKDNMIGNFYFYDGLPYGAGKERMILVGDVKTDDLQKLKKDADTLVLGECFLKGTELNVFLKKGRMKGQVLSKLMKEIGSTYSGVIVDGLEPNPTLTGAVVQKDDEAPKTPQQKQAENAVTEANRLYGLIPKGMSGSGVETLRGLRDKITELAEKDTPDLKSILTALKALKGAVEKLNDPTGSAPDPQEKAVQDQAARLWDRTMARFDKVKAILADDERKDLRIMWGRAEDAREGGDLKGMAKELKALDAQMIEYAKLAKEDKEKRVADGSVTQPMTKEVAKWVGIIDKKVKWVRKAEKLVTQERGAVEKIRFAILTAKEKSEDPTPLLADFDQAEKRLNAAREALVEQRRQHTELLKRLDAASGIDENVKRVAAAAEKDLAKLDALFEDIPMEEAKSQIQSTLEEMGAAIEWREKRLKEEVAEGKHGMGRHGPQTGLESQAVRASTTEAYLDTSHADPNKHKVKNRGGVTPDSTSNPAGTAQRVVKWNAIDITYQEVDGQRVIADVTKTAKQIAHAASNETASQVGSMWATPVLEKRAYDTFNKFAKALQKYQTYKKKSGNGYNQFNALIVNLSIAESGGAGWGYAVKKTGKKSDHLDEATAKGHLHDFQDGKISLDDLFKKLQVAMMETDPSGKNMVQGAKAVFKRDNSADDFKLVTMYPDNTVTKMEWYPNEDYKLGSLELKSPNPVGAKTFSQTAIPS